MSSMTDDTRIQTIYIHWDEEHEMLEAAMYREHDGEEVAYASAFTIKEVLEQLVADMSVQASLSAWQRDRLRIIRNKGG